VTPKESTDILEDPKDGDNKFLKMSVNCYQTTCCHIPAEGSVTVVVIIHCEENQLCVCVCGGVK